MRVKDLFNWRASVTVEVEKIATETPKAIKVLYCGYFIWLPKSRIQVRAEEDKIYITLPEWLHRKKFF